jgi:hypothetical protein
MSTLAMETAHLMNDFEEADQGIIHALVKTMHNVLRERRNRKKKKKIERGIRQIEEGRGIICDVVE